MTKTATQKIARQVEDTVDEVVHDLRKASHRINHQAEKQVTRAVAKFNKTSKVVAAEAREVAEAATETVKAHPLKSVAIMAGVAALIGYAFGRGLRSKR